MRGRRNSNAKNSNSQSFGFMCYTIAGSIFSGKCLLYKADHSHVANEPSARKDTAAMLCALCIRCPLPVQPLRYPLECGVLAY